MDPMPTGKTSVFTQLIPLPAIIVILLHSEVRLVEILDTVCTNHEVSTFHSSCLVPRPLSSLMSLARRGCHLTVQGSGPLLIKAHPPNMGPYLSC